MCVGTHTPIWIMGYILPHLLTFSRVDIVKYYAQTCKDRFMLRKTSHWTASSPNTCKAAQHWNIWWVCNRLCHYHPKAANGNILLILFVIDSLMDGEGWLKEMNVILWAQFVPVCGVAMTILLERRPETLNRDAAAPRVPRTRADLEMPGGLWKMLFSAASFPNRNTSFED